MFKAKVYQYSNINWKENKFEKEFDNEQEYQDFIRNNENRWFFGFDWNNLTNFNRYLDDFFDRKLGYETNYFDWETPALENDLVDLSKYEQELRKIEEDKKQKQERKSQLEATLAKLKDYKKRFKDEGKSDLLKNIESDISKVEQELKQV